MNSYILHLRIYRRLISRKKWQRERIDKYMYLIRLFGKNISDLNFKEYILILYYLKFKIFTFFVHAYAESLKIITSYSNIRKVSLKLNF